MGRHPFDLLHPDSDDSDEEREEEIKSSNYNEEEKKTEYNSEDDDYTSSEDDGYDHNRLSEEEKAKKEDANFLLFCKQLLLKSLEEDNSFDKILRHLFQNSCLFIMGKHFEEGNKEKLIQYSYNSLGNFLGFDVVLAIVHLKPNHYSS